VAEWLKAAPC